MTREQYEKLKEYIAICIAEYANRNSSDSGLSEMMAKLETEQELNKLMFPEGEE